ncbi:MAG: DUF4331 family protein [Candidatus Eisenbacteria bacterium]
MNKFSALAIGLALIACSAVPGARAADHKDSPATERDPATDIADVYAFRRADNLVVAMTVQNLSVSGNATDLFNPRARYQLFVDNSNDGVLAANATITVTFSGSNPQMFSVAGLTASPIVGATSGFSNAASPVITTSGAIKVFAGPRDDPFFFDLAGFRAFLAGTYTPASGLRSATGGVPRNAFAGLNAGAIVIELPIVALTGQPTPNTGVIRAWGATSVLR